MTISENAWLYKPVDGERVPYATQGYLRALLKHEIHALILDEFQRVGITQAELARRTGKRPDIICRLIGSPGNHTLDTISDVIFAMGGGVPTSLLSYPLELGDRNDNLPHFLLDEETNPTKDTPPETRTSSTQFLEPV